MSRMRFQRSHRLVQKPQLNYVRLHMPYAGRPVPISSQILQKETGGSFGQPPRCVEQHYKAEIFRILTDDRRRVKSHRLLFCLRKLPILAHEGTPSDELRFGTSSPQIGSRNLGLCVRILTPFRIAKGIDQKPLTVYFLRKARELYKTSPEKGLSPSFWDAEGIETQASTRFDGILPGLEHALGAWTYLW